MEIEALPTKRDGACIRVTAHTRMKLKKLPHALAVYTTTRDPGFAIGEMTD